MKLLPGQVAQAKSLNCLRVSAAKISTYLAHTTGIIGSFGNDPSLQTGTVDQGVVHSSPLALPSASFLRAPNALAQGLAVIP